MKRLATLALLLAAGTAFAAGTVFLEDGWTAKRKKTQEPEKPRIPRSLERTPMVKVEVPGTMKKLGEYCINLREYR